MAVVGAGVLGAREGEAVGMTVGEKVNCKLAAAVLKAVKLREPNPVTGSLQKRRVILVCLSRTC